MEVVPLNVEEWVDHQPACPCCCQPINTVQKEGPDAFVRRIVVENGGLRTMMPAIKSLIHYTSITVITAENSSMLTETSIANTAVLIAISKRDFGEGKGLVTVLVIR